MRYEQPRAGAARPTATDAAVRALPDRALPDRAEPSARRILIADSEEGIGRTLAAVLHVEGYDTSTACSTYETLRTLRERPHDLALIDQRLLESGDLLTRIRELAPDLIIIALIRFSAYDSALTALQSGAYSYLVKPIDIAELRLSVARALRHRRLEHAAAEQLRTLEAAQSRVAALAQDSTALQRKIESLSEANAQLRQAQEEHDRFVAMVAHEMRGPLNPIINYAQLAKRPGLAPQAIEHYTDIIVEHAFRLNRLVDDLQTATRLSTGQFTLRREHCNVTAVIGELIDSIRAATPERVFSYDHPADPIYAQVDRDRVVQAARNLIDNAVKYSTEGGAVEVTLWSDANNVYIRVRDYGAGIPEAEMQRIFDAFTRLNKSADVSGSGLGLYITRGIVAAHAGDLTVENGSGSERARGAIFTILLPLTASPSTSPTSPTT